MFDLEQSIADWRRQMLAAGIKTPVPLEELEIHLREEIEQQLKSGSNPQQAFENSVRRIGHADELKSEFKKTCGMKFYTRWMLLWIGGNGLIVTLILNLVGRFVFHRRVPIIFSHGWWYAWFPCYIMLIIRATVLVISWSVASVALFRVMVELGFHWNFFNWSPSWDTEAMVDGLRILAIMVCFWFLVKATLDRVSRVGSVLICLILVGFAVVYVLPAEPLTGGFLGRTMPSPLWYRGGSFLLFCLPGISGFGGNGGI